MSIDISKNQADQFYKKVKKSRNGCWFWRTRANEAIFTVRGRALSAQRVAWCINYPARYLYPQTSIRAKCDNALCVRPDHLTVKNEVPENAEGVSKEEAIRYTGVYEPRRGADTRKIINAYVKDLQQMTSSVENIFAEMLSMQQALFEIDKQQNKVNKQLELLTKETFRVSASAERLDGLAGELADIKGMLLAFHEEHERKTWSRVGSGGEQEPATQKEKHPAPVLDEALVAAYCQVFGLDKGTDLSTEDRKNLRLVFDVAQSASSSAKEASQLFGDWLLSYSREVATNEGLDRMPAAFAKNVLALQSETP